MKAIFGTTLLVFAAAALAGCATNQSTAWYEGEAHPEEVVLASCDSATATLKERPDYNVAHRACVRAKTRQKVD